MLRVQRRSDTTAVAQARGAHASTAAGAASHTEPAFATPATRSDALSGQLSRVVAGRTLTPMLQRVPAARVTEHATSTARIKAGTPTKRAEKFADLRASNRDDSHSVLGDLAFDHLWGKSASNVTGTGDEYSVRIDRQNPTKTGQNIQIQTNGESITLATVLVPDSAYTADARAVLTAVRLAFRNSLADGMQWEIYDAPVEKEVYVKGGKGGKGGGPKKGGPGQKKGGSGNKGGTGTGGVKLIKT